MTLDIDPSLQYSLLEYVAHLTSDNYDELPEDMVKIGFMKKEKLEFAKRSGVLEPLKYFLKKIGQGGGGTAVRERIYAEYREKNPGMSDEELRQVMRSEMKVSGVARGTLPEAVCLMLDTSQLLAFHLHIPRMKATNGRSCQEGRRGDGNYRRSRGTSEAEPRFFPDSRVVSDFL